MDLDFDADQEDLVRSLRTMFARMAGPARARALSEGLDRDLLDALGAAGFLDVATSEGGSLLGAVLVVEEAEAHHARAPVAARAIVAAQLMESPPAVVGLVDTGASSLVRYAGLCDCYLILDGPIARVVDSGEAEVTSVATRWGYPLGRITARRPTALGRGSGAELRAAWQVALAAEMGSAMKRAVGLTVGYVSERHQFGRSIGSYQAVGHQLARAAVAAEGSTWMARRAAADPADAIMAAAAATYAAGAARMVVEATHQVTGAIGITNEYDLVLSTMRLGVLLSEMGGARRHASVLADLRWPRRQPAPVAEAETPLVRSDASARVGRT